MFKKDTLRKNFLRVKQNIDQNLGRAEKSEVLSEDQQENEKRVEVVKHAVQNIVKKAGAVLQATGTDFDKRLKKLPETALGHAFVESAQSLGPDTLLGSACSICGDCQLSLAKEQVQYETLVEQEFIGPLQHVVDVDIPSIIKLRKALSKSTLDMDSAKTRFNQAVRQSSVPGANIANASAKADGIREEFEEASYKVETIKDNLSIELCNFAAKECDHSYKLVALLEAQANYHKKALEAIEDCIPQLKLAIQNSPTKPCFGMPLEEHLRLMCRDIALVLEVCVLTLLETGMEEEGLFRIAGAALKLKKLKANFDANAVDMEEFSTDPHTVAGALKQYLRELPEPLLTFCLYEEFLAAASLSHDQRLQALWTVVNKLPKPNYNNFRYLVKFLAKLAERSDVNKMKPSNIAIVMGPNLLWSPGDNTPNMLTTGTLSQIIESVVSNADWFFPGEIDFASVGYLTDLNSQHDQQYKDSADALTVQIQSSQNPAMNVSPAASNSSSTSSLPRPLDSPELSSPSTKRQARKPAPPPPPDRPFMVMVTAATGSNGKWDESAGDGSPQSWSRSAPLASPESPTEKTDRQKPSPERTISLQADRPGHPPPERPRLPPPVAAKGHQRSASTGAMIEQTGGAISGVPNAVD